jgi:hypothetical protein
MCMRIHLLLVAATLLSSAVVPAQTTAPRSQTPQQFKASLDEHGNDFDYLLGTWAFTSENREHGKSHGVWTAVKLPGGHIFDEFRVLSDSGETWYHTATLRVYDARADRWDLVSTGIGAGLRNIGTARKVGEEIHIEQTLGVDGPEPRPALARIRYYNIQKDRFSWVSDRSFDGGTTWILESGRIEARRIRPAQGTWSLTATTKPPR